MCGSCDFADIGNVREMLFGELFRRNYDVDFDSTYAIALGQYPYWMDRMTGHDIYGSRRPADEDEDLVETVDAPALFSKLRTRRPQRLPRFQL